MHKRTVLRMHDTFVAKDADYGSSFSQLRAKYKNAILIRVFDKANRLDNLIMGDEQKVSDESIDDTLLDLANYCIMEYVERHIDNEELADKLPTW